MKRIQLGAITFNGKEVAVAATLASTVKTTGEIPGQMGWSFDATYKRMKIVTRLQAAEKAKAEYVDLEDADYDLLKKIVTEDARYMAVDQGIVDLGYRVRNAADPEVLQAA